jgi:hypothetical protein
MFRATIRPSSGAQDWLSLQHMVHCSAKMDIYICYYTITMLLYLLVLVPVCCIVGAVLAFGTKPNYPTTHRIHYMITQLR